VEEEDVEEEGDVGKEVEVEHILLHHHHLLLLFHLLLLLLSIY
jgi:hypothetical protein